LQEEMSAINIERQTLLRKGGQLEGQVTFLERRIRQAHEKSESESEAPVPIGEIKKMLLTIESQVDKVVKSDDSSLLQRALSDVVHTFRKFIQNAAGVVVVSTHTEENELKEIAKELKENEKDTMGVSKREDTLLQEYNLLKKTIEEGGQESREAEREVFRIVGEQRECESTINQIDSELSVLERDRDEFKRELQESVSLIGSNAAQYYKFDIVENGKSVTNANIAQESRQEQRDRRRNLEKMKIRLEELGGANSDIEKEYKEVKERDEFLVNEIADLETSVTKLESLIVELATELNEQFLAGIDQIGTEFHRFFTLMFGGGEAKLIKVKPKIRKNKDEDIAPSDEELDETCIEEGVDIDVQLPNKKVRGLDMLSGGERALTSIALIFAMSQVNPPLFIILDETDAALDEANSRRYGDMVQALAEKSQLILITHNRETMSRAGVLYGVTMGGDGISKLLSVQLEEAVAVAK